MRPSADATSVAEGQDVRPVGVPGHQDTSVGVNSVVCTGPFASSRETEMPFASVHDRPPVADDRSNRLGHGVRRGQLVGQPPDQGPQVLVVGGRSDCASAVDAPSEPASM